MRVQNHVRSTGVRRFAVAFAGSGTGPAQDRVFGGGRTFGNDCTDGSEPYCSPVTREFSFLAVADGEGGAAHGTVTYGNLEFGGAIYVVRVACLAVEGNVAEIGGTVVRSALPDQVGDAFHMLVRDSGEPGTVAAGDVAVESR
jgi:hypothetical protein